GGRGIHFSGADRRTESSRTGSSAWSRLPASTATLAPMTPTEAIYVYGVVRGGTAPDLFADVGGIDGRSPVRLVVADGTAAITGSRRRCGRSPQRAPTQAMSACHERRRRRGRTPLSPPTSPEARCC